ncbi:MAG: hypothetical protein A2015_13365 [Spirochaetes bacterium GWF1_31_7]|nr:MAG: hypothetical protein A2Y30_11460 [Spirochaetes bacterium GWE1_32_154]OHD49811.1 MAG: hypothetical protein A2015_13365 [Spirochaetes bacterium GWF1_31_7]OHD52774.1 MAG: hypothetical protein A2Y29_15610 [Spirochaetes bacterium GWE2_31_10]OHD76723.1 MAG: hypothetical protein A2355_08120 [Spirochaetes bacterium RIFOXYB1_FULL_32_8]HBD92944.1 hypothetical protein [Spirochaetia bacterium]
MNKNLILLLLFFSFISINAADIISDNTDDEYVSKSLSMEVKNSFDKKYSLPAKEFFFFRGGVQITEKEFELIVKDTSIRENKKKLKDKSDFGFGSTLVLGGMATAFLIPSIVFVVTQTTYSQNYSLYSNYTDWFNYYSDNYNYTILPGLINIGLTFVFSVAAVINLAVTFGIINKYKYNENLYRDIIERYNRKLRSRYSVLPSISVANFGENDERICFSIKVTM